jgi:hypothetical protein
MKNTDPLKPDYSDAMEKYYQDFPASKTQEYMDETAKRAEEIIRNEPNPDLSDI